MQVVLRRSMVNLGAREGAFFQKFPADYQRGTAGPAATRSTQLGAAWRGLA